MSDFMMYSVGRKGHSGLELLSFNVDIEFCGWLLSLYQTGCPNSILSHQESDLIKVSQGFQVIYQLTANEPLPLSPIPGKLTSIFIVIGLGSLLCYRILKLINRFHLFSSSKSPSDSSGSIPSNSSSVFTVKRSYFGPKDGDCIDENNVSRKKSNLSSNKLIWPFYEETTRCEMDQFKLPKGWLLSNIQHYITPGKHSNKNTGDVSKIETAPITRHVKREGSVDSMCSELSLDFSEMVDNDFSTFVRMDQLQHEIDLLKTNCLLMDEEFETIKTNRNLPGLSSLLESSHQLTNVHLKESARACFKGLYSLTTINRSLSSDFSTGTSTDDDDSPIHGSLTKVLMHGEEGSFSSLEWDTQDAGTFILTPTDIMESTGYMSLQSSIITNDSLLPMEQSWSSDSFDLLIDSSENIEDDTNLQCDSSSSTRSGNNITNDGFTNINIIREIVGPVISVSDFIQEQWFYDSSIPESTRKGYEMITKQLGFRFIRKIHKDNYSNVRASLYQVLCLGLPLPSGQATMNHLMSTLLRNGTLPPTWNFSEQLPYNHQNCVRGFQICLAALDNVVKMLEGAESRCETLSTLMNNDPTLDAHLIEAIRLQMVAHVLSTQLKPNSDNYSFSQCFVHDDCNTEIDFMNNYLCPVGLSSELPKVELFTLLGCTLGVVLQIMNPSAFGSQEFKMFYPDVNYNDWPVIVLLSENAKSCHILLE